MASTTMKSKRAIAEEALVVYKPYLPMVRETGRYPVHGAPRLCPTSQAGLQRGSAPPSTHAFTTRPCGLCRGARTLRLISAARLAHTARVCRRRAISSVCRSGSASSASSAGCSRRATCAAFGRRCRTTTRHVQAHAPVVTHRRTARLLPVYRTAQPPNRRTTLHAPGPARPSSLTTWPRTRTRTTGSGTFVNARCAPGAESSHRGAALAGRMPRPPSPALHKCASSKPCGSSSSSSSATSIKCHREPLAPPPSSSSPSHSP